MYGGFSQLRSEGQNVAARQQSINSAYEQLLKHAEERQKKLEDSIKLFGLYNECEEVEAWVREKEAVLKVEEKGSTKEQMESMQKKYDVSSQLEYTCKHSHTYPCAHSIVHTYLIHTCKMIHKYTLSCPVYPLP